MSIRNRISWPLHYSLIKKFGRALKGNPLSNKTCLVPILANNAYEIYHTLCLNWRRISFNNSNAAQLRARAIKKGLLSETFLRTGGQPSTPHPKTETRELCIFKDGKSKLDIFFLLHLCHLPSVTGFGCAKILAGGDIVVPYHITIRFSSNEKLHSAHITCNISWCILSTERELKLSPSAGLAISAERELDGIMQRLPRQLRRRRPQLTIDSGFFAGERTAAIERRALEPNPTPQGQLSPQQPASRVAACRAPYVFGRDPGVRHRSATNRLRAAVPTPSPATFCAAPWCGKRLSLCNSAKCKGGCAEWFCVLHGRRNNHTCRRKPTGDDPYPVLCSRPDNPTMPPPLPPVPRPELGSPSPMQPPPPHTQPVLNAQPYAYLQPMPNSTTTITTPCIGPPAPGGDSDSSSDDDEEEADKAKIAKLRAERELLRAGL